jgi:protein SCO1
MSTWTGRSSSADVLGHVLRAAAAAAALALLLATVAFGGGPGFLGPTIKNPTVPPDFALRDQDGRVVELHRPRGRVVLVTFLYTHCPDVCPLTAEHLNRALQLLGKGRTHVRVLAVSVDPKGDGSASVRAFVRAHHFLPQFRYLVGPAPALRALWAAYGVKSLAQAGDRVDHTLYTLLIDRSSKGRVLYDSTATAPEIAHDVRLLLGSAR